MFVVEIVMIVNKVVYIFFVNLNVIENLFVVIDV